MVSMSVPSTIPDFEGEISHVVVAGNETLTFVKPSTWQGEWNKIRAKLLDLAPSAQKITSLPAVKSGEIYIVKMKNSFERSYIIRRPTPETYSIYLIDKGMQCETKFGEIYEIPPELLEFGLFSCVCPVLVPSAEQLNIYKAYIGHKCKCIVESVSKSIVVMGYVRGRLLVENDGIYEDLQDIVSSKTASRLGGKFNVFASGQIDDSSSSSSDSTFHRLFAPKAGQKANFVGRKEYVVAKKGKQNHADVEFVAEYDRIKAGTLFNQTAFKQYEPEMVPITVSVRFDKRDRTLSTFWVVNKKIFTAVERALKDSADKLSRFPLLRRKGEDVQMRQTPCIVRARADTAYKSLYRAVPAQYDIRTKRFSIFLVDFGWFKWVLANDIIDISTMDKSDPIMNLPVAMIHCREDTSSTLHAKDLNKGANCVIVVKGQAVRDVYTVDLMEAPTTVISRLTAAINEQPNGRETAVGNLRETEVIASCRKLVTETCQRQLMTSMMMETLSIANRELAQQPQHFWPNFYPSPFSMPMPMMMPVPFPVMMPVPVPSVNLQGAGDNSTVMPESMPANNFENSRNGFERGKSGFEGGKSGFENGRNGFESGRNGFENGRNSFENYSFTENSAKGCPSMRTVNGNRSPRFQSSYSQPAKDWQRGDFNTKNGSDKNRKSSDEGNAAAAWDLPSKLPRDRTFQRNWDNNSPKTKLTSWEKAVAANRANRTQPDNSTDAA